MSGDALSHVWAKSAEKGKTGVIRRLHGAPNAAGSDKGVPQGELLSAHTGHVLASLQRRRERYPGLATHGDRADLFDLAAWAIVLHDLGKCAHGFQTMVRGGPRYEHRHEVLSLVAVGRLDVDEETRGLIAAGVGTHHKDASWIRERYPFDSADRDELLDELTSDHETAWEAWLAGAGAPNLTNQGFLPLPPRKPLGKRHALASAMRALQELVERLGADDATSRPALTARAVRGLVVLADHAGSAHERLTFAPSLDSVKAFREAAASRLDRGLEPHQEQAGQTDGHALLVAPTGSGKTEAAFLWASRQREHGAGKAALFYVLPYRASLNAMRERIPSYGVVDGSVVLQHSSSAAALYGYLMDKPDGYTPSAAAKIALRERNLASLMTAPVRVLTPYQLLRAFFGLPGHEAVLTDAAGGVIVLDELHAYDVPRLALILAGVRHLVRDLGARVIAMSATFPSVLRGVLEDVLGGNPTRIVADRETQERFVRHMLRVAERDLVSEETLTDVERRFRDGEAVLVVATTVGRAQRFFDAARARLGVDGVSLLHGRFAGRDRGEKERQLATRVGTRTRDASTRQGTLLVATQVVEVSLDVDFDILFTDPAPIEALLQRFGRVNRGRRGGLRDVVVHTHHADEATRVYSAHLITAALEVLRPNADRAVQEWEVQEWVDSAYAPIAGAWNTELRAGMAAAEENVIRINRPLDSHPDLAKLFDELFDGNEVVPKALVVEYEQLLVERPLEATMLRIPISNGQRMMLRKKGLLERRGSGIASFEVALVPYDTTRGLDLTTRDDES